MLKCKTYTAQLASLALLLGSARAHALEVWLTIAASQLCPLCPPGTIPHVPQTSK